jgi:hypothetical protein
VVKYTLPEGEISAFMAERCGMTALSTVSAFENVSNKCVRQDASVFDAYSVTAAPCASTRASAGLPR